MQSILCVFVEKQFRIIRSTSWISWLGTKLCSLGVFGCFIFIFWYYYSMKCLTLRSSSTSSKVFIGSILSFSIISLAFRSAFAFSIFLSSVFVIIGREPSEESLEGDFGGVRASLLVPELELLELGARRPCAGYFSP